MKFLYSINSFLAYKICEHFYEHNHYVWCSPFYNAKEINPPSSDPFEICQNLIKEVEADELHSSKIQLNKSGIITGANANFTNGNISAVQKSQILSVVEEASINYFRPLIYIIYYKEVEDITEQASIELKAGLFSKEFLITKLPRDKFDIIDIYKNRRYV